MIKTCLKTAAALLLALPLWHAHAAEVSLNGWAYANGVSLSLTNPLTGTSSVEVQAGALEGHLRGTGRFDANPFITYMLEVNTADVRFGEPAAQYSLVAGADYFQRRMGQASLADRLGQLMSYAADQSSSLQDAAGAASLQLAIWSLVQDPAARLGNLVRNLAANDATATKLLAGSEGLASRYEVWALERVDGLDLMVVAPFSAASGELPEPGSLALCVVALAGLAGGRRAFKRGATAPR